MKRLVAILVAGLAALPVPASAAVLFREDFAGPSGAAPNSAFWKPLACTGFIQGRDCTSDRARLDGAGSLYLEVTPYRGGFIGTFDYGTGWPPSGAVRASWSVPFTVTARMKMPTVQGVWSIVWLMNVDRTRAQGIWELDGAEPRSSLPTRGAAYHHFFSESGHWQYGCSVEIGGVGAWHTYTLQVLYDRTVYKVDGMTCMTRNAVKGRFGLLLTSLAGPAGSWFTNYGPALSGTARTYIDYVEVSR